MNTSEIPNGGWQFMQPQTGWTAPSPVGYTFDQQIVNIIKHRRANPAIVQKHKLSLDPAMVGQELINFQIARGAIKAPPKPMLSSVLPQLPGAAHEVVAAVKKLAAGAGLLFEWEESGLPPEPSEESARRAAICVPCPKNDKGGLSKYFTKPIADNIRAKIGRLHEMKLSTPHDSELGICSACLCDLKLKPHTPTSLILKRLKPEQRAELDPQCWILAL